MSRQQQPQSHIPTAHHIRSQQALVHHQIVPIPSPFQTAPSPKYHPVHPQSQSRPRHRSPRPMHPLPHPPPRSVTNGRVSGPVVAPNFTPSSPTASTMHQDTLRTLDKMNAFIDAFSGLIRSNGSHRFIQSDYSQSRLTGSDSDANFNNNETRVTNEVVAAVEAAHTLQLRALKKIGDRVGRLEKSISLGAGHDQWMERLAAIESTVEMLARDYTRRITPASSGIQSFLFVKCSRYSPKLIRID